MLSGTAVASLARPWIGVTVAYLFVILVPQSVWWWNFQDLRPVLWILLPTLAGFALAVLKGKIQFQTLANKRTFFVLILWLFFALSYLAGPYVNVQGEYRFTDPAWAMSTVNKILVLYFLACLCIDAEVKLKYLVYVVTGSGIYLIYWANMRYLNGQVIGRMSGPTSLGGGGIYADENNFAMLFVVILPFIWYLGFAIRKRMLRWAFWLIIPFGWHAVFLTGSRGGLVGIAVTMLIMIWRTKNKLLGVLLVPAFIIAYIWQAGDVMRERADTLSEYETEASAAGRLEAWGAATNMIINHPVTGVGLASFGPAFQDHSEGKPRVAHNTFFQIAGESGLIAGLMYLSLVAANLLALWRTGKRLHLAGTNEQPLLYWINEAVLAGFTGLVVCSMFLSLQLFEIFYCLSVMVNALVFIVSRSAATEPQTAAHRARA